MIVMELDKHSSILEIRAEVLKALNFEIDFRTGKAMRHAIQAGKCILARHDEGSFQWLTVPEYLKHEGKIWHGGQWIPLAEYMDRTLKTL